MKTTKMQFPLFTQPTEWVPPSDLPDLRDATQLCIDIETRDPNIKKKGPGWPTLDGEIIGYAVAVDGWSGYMPVAHHGGGNLDKRIVERWLQKQLAAPSDKIMHNAQYDLGWLRAAGFEVNGRIIDTMVTANLIDENRFSYSLNALGYDYLGKTKSEKGLVEAAKDFGVDPKSEMWKLPAQFVGQYAEGDATLTLELWNFFKPMLTQEGLQEIWDLETRLLPCLVEMTLRGVRVDLERAERSKQVVMKREKELMKTIKGLAGKDVEIWAAQSIAEAFDKVGLEYPRTDKGAPSFTKSFLSDHKHELPQAIVQARAYNKINGTFIDGILKYVGPDGRIHGHINQIRSDDGGTVSGRVSMNNPNLQQIPARDPELGPMIRSLFLPEEGEQWASIDFSQQEPRIAVHYAHTYGQSTNNELTGVKEMVDAYTNDPSTDFHTMVTKLTGLDKRYGDADKGRKAAKSVGLGIIYGMGVNKLAGELDVEVDEAKDILKQFNDTLPFLKQLNTGVMRRLEDPRSSGSIRSLRGRKCRFNLWEPAAFGTNKAMPYEEARHAYGPTTRLKRAMTYKALNRLIQASAADMTKQAWLDCYEAGHLPLIQVHDELAFSVNSLDKAKEIREIMINSLPLVIPNKCDIDIGPSWGETKEVKG
jgi:DNA polymerase I-like protein with 3'-5' exonuclease and polymerase domains